jgi:hypothetical protein
MLIQIIGVGCAQCRQMKADVSALVSRLGLQAQIEHIDDPYRIVSMRIISIPQLAVDGKTVMVGYRGRSAVERALREASTALD